jgi:hypothetical protein
MFFCSYGCTAGVRTPGVVRRGGGPAAPLVRVGCSLRSARHDTLSDDGSRIKLVSTYDPQAYGPTPFSPRDSQGSCQSAEQGDC